MRSVFLFFSLVLLSMNLEAQNVVKKTFWQAKVDFLEPIVNKSAVARIDYGFDRHIVGLVGGFGGHISEFDNKQYDTYQDKINYRLGIEYQYFLSKNKLNRGFYLGADFEYGSHTVESKISSESVNDLSVVTPGLWFGYLWKPFKRVNLLVDLTIIHPRYTLGSLNKVEFQTVAQPYEPQNLFNFLGPWSIGWRF